MTLEELQAKIGDFSTLISDLRSEKIGGYTEDMRKQYDVSLHDVLDPTKRQDKLYTDDRGQTTTSPVNRLGLPLQKQIVGRAASFLCGNPIQLSAAPADDLEERMLKALQKVWDDNKLDYKSKSLAKHMMSETEVAELWYVEPIAETDQGYWGDVLSDKTQFKLRMRVLAPSLGDKLYPSFDPSGDLIAFGREYKISIAGGKTQDRFDIYTATETIEGAMVDGAWTVTSKTHPYKKIPVIYYAQPKPEWADVQSLIDRLEKQMSNHSDVNDYFGSPLLVVTGKILSFAKKGESGKVMEIEAGASINYATWNQAPESVKMEMDNLLKQIHSCTDTPNISFDEMKGLGTFSGVALKLLFMAAHMKASDKEEIFGEGIQRRINYLKNVIGVIDLSMEKARLTVKPKFEFYLPKNVQEAVDVLVNAFQGKIISQDTAVTLNPLVVDAAEELARIKEAEDSAGALDEQMNP